MAIRRLIWLPKPFDMTMGVGDTRDWRMGLVEPVDATQEATMLSSMNGGQVWDETDGKDLTPLSESMTGDGPTTPPAPAPAPSPPAPPPPAEPPAPAPEQGA